MKKFTLLKRIHLLVLLSGFCLSSCSQGGEQATETSNTAAGAGAEKGTIAQTQIGVDEVLEGDTMNFQATTPPAFSAQFQKLVDAYLEMKNAFVQENAAVVNQQAKAMMTALQQVPDNGLSGTALTYWQEKKEFLGEHLNLYKEAETMEAKRENFAFLSTVMVKAVQAFGYPGETLFVDYCPMANDNRGAYWLSQTKEIFNPYFGDKMLKCGEVKKEI